MLQSCFLSLRFNLNIKFWFSLWARVITFSFISFLFHFDLFFHFFFVYLKLLQHSQVVKSKSGLKIEPKNVFFSSSFFWRNLNKNCFSIKIQFDSTKKQIFIIKLSFLYNFRFNFHKKRIFFPKSYNKFQKYFSLKIFSEFFFCSNVMLYIKHSSFLFVFFNFPVLFVTKKYFFTSFALRVFFF